MGSLVSMLGLRHHGSLAGPPFRADGATQVRKEITGDRESYLRIASGGNGSKLVPLLSQDNIHDHAVINAGGHHRFLLRKLAADPVSGKQTPCHCPPLLDQRPTLLGLKSNGARLAPGVK